MAAEKYFENRIKSYLKKKGAYFIKYWGGGYYTRSGVPDLLVCLKGQFLGIELKAPKGHEKELQVYHLSLIDKAGGYGILLFPKDIEIFEELIELIVGDTQAHRSAAYKHFKKYLIQ